MTPAQPDTFSRTVTPAQPDTFPRIVTPADGPNPVPRPMDLPNDVSTLAVPKNPRATAGKRGTVRHRATLSRVTVRTVRSSRSTQVSQMTRDTCFTVRTAVTRHTGHTGATGQTGQTALSRFSNLTNLKNAQNFQFHPAAIASLEARVAPKMGTIFEEEEEQERPKSIPWDLVCPALMISLCCFNNSVSGWCFRDFFFFFSIFTVFHMLQLEFTRLTIVGVLLGQFQGLLYHGAWNLCAVLQGVPWMGLRFGNRFRSMCRGFVCRLRHEASSKFLLLRRV